MNPLVSVIIPSFGGNASLERALDSVLDQEYEPFEVIVVDDNEPDSEGRKSTESMMAKYKESEQVLYIKHERNKNGAAARNTGVKAAKGKYVTFLDDDDRFLPHKLEKQADYLELHPEFGAVYCWRIQNGEIVSGEFTGNLSEQILDMSFAPSTPAIMIRTSFFRELNGFDESFQRHQDYEFLLRFFKQYSIGVVREPLVEIIGNSVDNTLTGERAIALKKQFLGTFEATIDELDRESKGFKKRVWAVHYSALAITLTVKGQFRLLVQSYVQEGYKGGVFFWKNYLGRLWRLFKYQFTKRALLH